MEDQQRAKQKNPADSDYPVVNLKVDHDSISFFTTALQSGIEVITESNISLGKFLCSCPGFSEEYISEVVQTIFLNGTALDDLQTPLSGGHPVVALSAAMPGLAGAIFRKNSLHSALRTKTSEESGKDNTTGPLTVTLKLFNRIAREKGELLLSLGCVIASEPFSVFLVKRPEIMNRIKAATLAHETIPVAELPHLVKDFAFVKLIISEDNG